MKTKDITQDELVVNQKIKLVLIFTMFVAIMIKTGDWPWALLTT